MVKELRLLNGDCIDKLKELDNNSIDSIVTDPPYGLSFMGKKWDYDVPSVEIWQECLRVLKPGGHLLAFAGSRTYHRMAVRIEDAGFDIRDQIMWIYGSGFPKSHNVGKSIDKKEGNEREVIGVSINDTPNSQVKGGMAFDSAFNNGQEHQPILNTKGNSEWEGWGTALKPAHEPIVMARKPIEGTVAENTLQYGVGGLNIDATRVTVDDMDDYAFNMAGNERVKAKEEGELTGMYEGGWKVDKTPKELPQGRWPANVILECTCENPKVVSDKYDIRTYNDYKNTFKSYEENDKDKGEYEIKDVETTKVIHTDPNCPCYILDEQSGNKKSAKRGSKYNKPTEHTNTYTPVASDYRDDNTYGDEGGASRFFYCPKANAKDRDSGMPEKVGVFIQRPRREDGSVIYKETNPDEWAEAMKGKPRSEKTAKAAAEDLLQDDKTARRNVHPTVKPTELMKYLIRLVTPKAGIVLDPFMGSGSTGKAAMQEGMWFVGIERESEYFEIAKQRIEYEADKRKFW
jgi:site-specific DNA-methyltransferase (adenine-specific)